MMEDFLYSETWEFRENRMGKRKENGKEKREWGVHKEALIEVG